MRGHLNPCYLLGIPHDLGNPQMAGNLGIDAQVTSHESSLGWRFGWALGAILGVSSKGKWISMVVSGSGCVLSFLVGRFSTITLINLRIPILVSGQFCLGKTAMSHVFQRFRYVGFH